MWPKRTGAGCGSALALLGTLVSGSRRGRVALLLWAPLPFYALSIAYGSVPIFVPTWWPFSEYNLRYGLQFLPAFAVFVPLGISFPYPIGCEASALRCFMEPLDQRRNILAILLLWWRAMP